MEHDIHTHLYDIVQSCQNIRAFTRDIDHQTYSDNLLIKSAVERQFIIIGEALNRELCEVVEDVIRRFECEGRMLPPVRTRPMQEVL